MTKILSFYHIEYLEDCHFDYWDTSCCHNHHQDYLDDQDPYYHDYYLEDAFDEVDVDVVIGGLDEMKFRIENFSEDEDYINVEALVRSSSPRMTFRVSV